MENNRSINIGWAQISITPARPLILVGQMYQRISKFVHDPIMATALVIENGDDQAIFVSMDMTMIPPYLPGILKNNLSKFKGIDTEKISLHTTHTHNSSDFYGDFMREGNEHVYGKEILPSIEIPEDLLFGREASEFLSGKLTDLIKHAWESRTPGGISYAHDYAAISFNRRPMFKEVDGKCRSFMYGDCSRQDFRCFEDGTDNSAEMLYTWNKNNDITGLVINVSCPSQVYELHQFISADFWAPTRNAIRESLGNIYVMPACGAAGDLSPIDLVHISKNNKNALREWAGQSKEVFRNFDMTLLCQSIAERICEAVLRGYKYARNYINYCPEFNHSIVNIDLPLRTVSENEYMEAAECVKNIKKRFSSKNRMTMEDVVKAFEPQGVVMRWELQQKSKNYAFKSHMLRIGNIAIATNPFELYHEFAQRIKARAKAEQVFIIQLSNGYGGYLPTEIAVNGGSYSSKPTSTICGPEGGDILVEQTLQYLNDIWK